MNDGMESQEDVMRVLRLLGSAAPPDGIETRVVAKLRARQFEIAARRRWWTFDARIAWAAVAVVIAALAAGLHGRAVKTEQVSVPVVRKPREAAVPIAAVAALPVHARRRVVSRASHDVAARGPMNAPALPLTQQERLLLALAKRPQLLPELRSITKTEMVKGNGVGENSIFELATQPLEPVQAAPLGDFE